MTSGTEHEDRFDEQLDRLVRNADPYRPSALGHLDDGQDALLAEVMKRRPIRRGFSRQVAGAIATAAVLLGVFAAATVLRVNHDKPLATPVDGPATSVASTAPATVEKPSSPAAMSGLGSSPRLILKAPGWKVSSVYGFIGADGSLSFQNGRRQIELTWYAADQYGSYYTDRLEVSAPESVKASGWPGDVFKYSDSDFAIMLKPRDGTFVELRTSGTWTREQFDQILTHLVRVDVKSWLAAMPPEIVIPARVDEAAAKVLADIPMPPRFDPASLSDLGTNDAYQFGAGVTGRVGCAWVTEWIRAKQAGDTAARQAAAAALRSSHHWKELVRMDAEGRWSQTYWEIADSVAAGHPIEGWASSLGCDH